MRAINGMYDTRYKFLEGARVRLKAGVDPYIYGDFARVGNEGTIAERDRDRFGLPEVYVKWDKNHWAYNGVQDCWTFEEHFELVKEEMANDKNAQLAAMFQQMAELMNEEAPQAPKESPKENSLAAKFRGASKGYQKAIQNDPDVDEEYDGAVNAATEKLAESEAFVIIGVKRTPHPGMPEGILDPYALGFSKTDEGDVLVTAHMGSVAARAHQELALQMIAEIVAAKSS